MKESRQEEEDKENNEQEAFHQNDTESTETPHTVVETTKDTANATTTANENDSGKDVHEESGDLQTFDLTGKDGSTETPNRPSVGTSAVAVTVPNAKTHGSKRDRVKDKEKSKKKKSKEMREESSNSGTMQDFENSQKKSGHMTTEEYEKQRIQHQVKHFLFSQIKFCADGELEPMFDASIEGGEAFRQMIDLLGMSDHSMRAKLDYWSKYGRKYTKNSIHECRNYADQEIGKKVMGTYGSYSNKVKYWWPID